MGKMSTSLMQAHRSASYNSWYQRYILLLRRIFVPHRDSFEYYDRMFASFGLTEQGGLTRLLYTDAWMDAQTKLKKEMEAAGMHAAFDAVGNLFGSVPGSDPSAPSVATGSHIDTVVEGGRLDGQFGIIAGLIAIKNLVSEHGRPTRTLQLISVAEEEGSRFPAVFWGSKNIFNLIEPDEWNGIADLADNDGVTFGAEMRRHGFDFRNPADPVPNIGTFVELHIEQGNCLEKKEKPIGVITAITGQKRYEVTLTGEANHAGTTRMEYRRDAIQAYARIVDTSLTLALAEGDPLVLTFGQVTVQPNTVNVVPGSVTFSIDCRHPDGYMLNNFAKKLEAGMKQIAAGLDIGIAINKWMDCPPVPMNYTVVNQVEAVVKAMGIDYEIMHSGAGHDAQIFAPRVPTGMIFVPSIKGISHNPKENTATDDLVLGIRVLENTLHKLAYE